MKQTIRLFAIALIAFGFSVNSFAQQDCATAVDVTVLPYSASGLTTVGMLNDYTSADACLSASMDNEDYVLSITPSSDMQINVELSNTELVTSATVPMANLGLFITEGCPDVGTCVAYVDDVQSNPALNDVNLTSGITYYIIISSANALLGEATNVNFDIDITKNAEDDLAVTSIEGIVSDCGLTTLVIGCNIENLGLNSQTGFDIYFDVDGTGPQTAVYSGTLDPGATDYFEFATPADVSGVGSHTVEVGIPLVTDENLTDNTLSETVVNMPVYSSFPASEDFETNNGYWLTGGTASSWEYGNPDELLPELVINSANSGDNIWVTALDGTTNTSETSYIESPCYDLSGLLLPTIEFYTWVNFSLYGNSANLQASIDGGATWTVDLYTFEETDTWEEVYLQSAELVGQSNVKFRINYESGFLAAEGLAIDDFTVKEAVLTDVGVVALHGPNSGCGLTATETISVVVENFGAQSISDIVVDYSLDGGVTWLSSPEIISVTMVPGETYLYNFTQTADLSAFETYDFVAKTIQPGDEDHTNDELTANITSQETIIISDYTESFEAGNGGWMAFGENSTMELAMPANTLINAAAEGDYAWVTNATGNNSSNELSFLESPCFDFSGLTNPVLKAMVQYETTQLTTNFFVSYTIDGGATWDTINAGLASTNWYGTDMLGFGTWSGSSEGWIQVSTDVPELAGQADVKLRFVFDNGDFAIGETEGVAIDMINISDCTNLPTSSFTYTVDGSTVNFSNESENGTSYEWNFGDNEFLPSTSTEENPSFTYLMDGSYTVSLTVTNECSSATYSTIIDISTIIKENESFTGIYPNPANDFLYIEYENLSSYQIMNMSGQFITSKEVEGKTKVDLSDLRPGVYFIKLKTPEFSFTKQFIKE